MLAILVPVCSRNQTHATFEETPLFTRLLPSLRLTTTLPYRVYVGYDDDDAFYVSRRSELEAVGTIVELKGCQHAPARAWNQLAEVALKNGHDYYFQVGDDVVMETPGWDSAFVQSLGEHGNLGAVGPCNPVNYNQRKRAGKPAVIENAFVHRTHLEIFGYFFHPKIANWYCDDWMSRVYDPTFSCVDTQYLCSNTLIDCRYRIQACPELQTWVREGQGQVAARGC